MIRFLKLLALLLPLLLPALLAANILYERHQAPVHLVRIEGYDPRDLLYGRYITFRYNIDQSANAQSFPDDMAEIVANLPTRFYIDERRALAVEALLRDGVRTELEVGVPARGKPFIGRLYLNGVPMDEAAAQP